ncbi:MAG: helix-turn-helix transcriptional regulator [Rhodospirillaceae bacterium]|jgi:transcriptional regulator with XRE-family HTH domain
MAKAQKKGSQSGKAGKAKTKQSELDQGAPHPIDIHVGSRVRLRRTLLGLSQEKLGEAVGLTFQQIQKYERGANRIGASRLHEFSQILEVPVSFFFEGTDTKAASSRTNGARGNNKTKTNDDYIQKRETLELVRAYYQIPDTIVRKRLFETIKALAKSPDSRA